MGKFNKFLRELHQNLYFFSEEEIEQILMDYRELYNDKIETGLKEEEIIKSFDTPKQIAKNYSQELEIKTSFLSKICVNFKRDIDKNTSKAMDSIDEYVKKSKEKYSNYEEERRRKKENTQGKAKTEENNADENKAIVNNKLKPLESGIEKFCRGIIWLIKGLTIAIWTIFKIIGKFFLVVIIFGIILSIVIVIIVYIFSFIFLEIKVDETIIRFLETVIVISYTVCSLLVTKFLCGAFRE